MWSCKENQSELEREKQASDALLLNILPSVIAKRLKGGETSIADEFPEVSVLFRRSRRFHRDHRQDGTL